MSLYALEPLQGELSISVVGKPDLDRNLSGVSRQAVQCNLWNPSGIKRTTKQQRGWHQQSEIDNI